MKITSLIVALFLSAVVPLRADDASSIPELVVPGNAETKLPPGVVRQFGSGAFRHLGIGPANLSPAEPFFSPNGDTVYVSGDSSLIAFDAATGRERFHYRYSLLNFEIRNEGTAGIRVNFHQGPLSGQFALLEHGTGRELQRGHQVRLEGLQMHADFAAGSRAVASRIERGNPLDGPLEKSSSGLYDVPNNKLLAELGPNGRTITYALSPDRHRLAFCTLNWELRVFDTDDGRLLHSLPLGLRENYAEQCRPVWSHDGKAVYVWRRQAGAMELIAFDIGSGEVRVLIKDPRVGVFSSAEVSPDGRLLAYRLNDNPWEQNSYWRIVRLADLTEAHVIDIRPTSTFGAFSPNSRSFWLLGESGLARFDLSTGKFDPLSADPLAKTQALAFSRDGTRLYEVAGSQLLTWDVITGNEIAPRTGFEETFRANAHHRCIYISPDGHRTIWTGKSHVHALVDGQPVGMFYASNTGRHQEFDLTADYRQIVHDAYYGELKLGDLWTGKTLRELLPVTRPRENFRIALAPDNRTLALVHFDHRAYQRKEVEIELWDIQQGRKTGAIRQVSDLYLPMQFSQDSRELRVWDRRQMTVWDISERTQIRRQEGRPASYSLASTPNRHWTINCRHRPDGVRELELIDIHTSQVARTWDYPGGGITAIAFSPDNVSLAIASSGEPAALYRRYDPRPKAFPREPLTDEQLIELLSDKDAVQAFDALCELIRRGDNCLPALRTFVTRPLRTQAGSGDISRDQLAIYRSVEILGAIGTPAAHALLEQLSRSDENQPATREAIATLSRIKMQ